MVNSARRTRRSRPLVKAARRKVLDALSSITVAYALKNILRLIAFGALQLIVLHLYVWTSTRKGLPQVRLGNPKSAAGINNRHDLRDNIAGKPFPSAEFTPLPIDVVYTWVNGSDPVWIREKERQLRLYAEKMKKSESGNGTAAQGNTTKAGEYDNITAGKGAGEIRNMTWLDEVDHALADHMNISKSDFDDLLAEGFHFDEMLANVTSAVTGATRRRLDEAKANETRVEKNETNDDSNRYRDNEELRYSLRSIEKYAPWVRKIYLVTDNQVPYWLNSSSGRLQVVSHKDIFTGDEREFLPLFSSPAIETRLHRIPGVSKRFIYFNDDVLLGAPVLPGDFLTSTGAQKIYLAWDVPQCNQGCIETWITDGYCDVNCNVSACDWDGGDCIGNNKAGQSTTTHGHYGNSGYTAGGTQASTCKSSCPSHWMGDNACDFGCNHVECAFDGGDCGLDRVWGASVADEIAAFSLDGEGERRFGNYSSAEEGNITEHADNSAKRTASVESSYGTLRYSGISPPEAVSVKLANALEYWNDFSLCASAPDSTSKWAVSSATHNGEDIVARAVYRAPESILVIVFGEGIQLNNRTVNIELAYERPGNMTVDCIEASKLTLTFNVALEIETEVTNATVIANETVAANPANDTKIESEETVFVDARIVGANETDDLASRRARRRLGSVERRKCPFMRWFYQTVGWGKQPERDSRRRRILGEDTYAMSIVHTNRLFRRDFGKAQRKVPAHMPHLIDIDAIEEVQQKYKSEFEATMSHRFRHKTDMQYAFSYMYWLVSKGSEPSLAPLEAFQREFDTNGDGVLDENEIRTLTAVVLGPDKKLTPEDLQKVKDCLSPPVINASVVVTPEETIYRTEKKVRHVTASRYLNCSLVMDGYKKYWRKRDTHIEITDIKEVAFEMLSDDINETLAKLDSVRARKTKFICLNDNMHNPPPLVLQHLREYYEGTLPMPSQFELADGVRNLCLRPSECIVGEQGELVF